MKNALVMIDFVDKEGKISKLSFDSCTMVRLYREDMSGYSMFVLDQSDGKWKMMSEKVDG